jgi:hypothetical protein
MPHQSTRVTLHCQHCGTAFTANAARAKSAKYCTKHCSSLAREKSRRERVSAEDRFWSFVDRSGECWIWTGWCDKDGYGGFRWHDGQERAHRVSWEIAHGPIPEGHLILHRCDNPPCVNPDHLYDGTQQDNMTEKSDKGRGATGERHPMAKLTEDAVRNIRSRLTQGESLSSIGRVYGVHMGTIWRIREGRLWKDVT